MGGRETYARSEKFIASLRMNLLDEKVAVSVIVKRLHARNQLLNMHFKCAFKSTVCIQCNTLLNVQLLKLGNGYCGIIRHGKIIYMLKHKNAYCNRAKSIVNNIFFKLLIGLGSVVFFFLIPFF